MTPLITDTTGPKTIVLDHTPGRGRWRFILVPGLVPDGPHTFLFQTRLLRRFGDLITLTYPYDHFSLDETIACIAGQVQAAHRAGRRPVLVGVSVGGGVILEWLRRTRLAGEAPELGGLILISPLSCAEDLSPLLKRLLAPVMAEAQKADGLPEQALQRGREFFMGLAAKSAGAPRRVRGLRRLFDRFTPAGYAARRDHAIRSDIEQSLGRITDRTAVERVVALKDFRGVHGLARAHLPVTTAPVLILWGAKERQTLDVAGPGASVLCRPDLCHRLFPNVEIHWVYNPDGEEAPHASLLKHARAFNRHLSRYCTRLGTTRTREDD